CLDKTKTAPIAFVSVMDQIKRILPGIAHKWFCIYFAVHMYIYIGISMNKPSDQPGQLSGAFMNHNKMGYAFFRIQNTHNTLWYCQFIACYPACFKHK